MGIFYLFGWLAVHLHHKDISVTFTLRGRRGRFLSPFPEGFVVEIDDRYGTNAICEWYMGRGEERLGAINLAV